MSNGFSRVTTKNFIILPFKITKIQGEKPFKLLKALTTVFKKIVRNSSDNLKFLSFSRNIKRVQE